MCGSVFYKPIKWANTEVTPGCVAFETAEIITTFGVAVIVALGLTGFIAPTAVGYSIVILKGLGYFFDLAKGNWSERRFYLIAHAFFAAALVTLGALGALGALSIYKMGWSVVGILFANCVLNCSLQISKCCYKTEKKKLAQNN